MSSSRLANAALNGATAVVTVLAITVSVMYIRTARSDAQSATTAFRTEHVANWRHFADGGTRAGTPAAPVTLVEFLDYQCPFCRAADGDLKDLRRWYGNRLSIVYRQLPIHKFAHTAGIASQCASRFGRFSEFHELLFREQDSIGLKSWLAFAQQAGIHDSSRFATCMRDPSLDAAVANDSAAARELGANGTPTFLINDTLLAGYPGLTQLAAHIQAALKHRAQ